MLRKLFGRPDVKEAVKKSKTDIRKGVRGELIRRWDPSSIWLPLRPTSHRRRCLPPPPAWTRRQPQLAAPA